MQSIQLSQYKMNLTSQIDTWRIHLALEGISICVKLMQLILLSLALDLTSVKFLLLELHSLDDWEQADTIGEEGRVEGGSILFCFAPSSISKISTQEHTGLHLVSYSSRAMQILLTLLLWWSYLNHECHDTSSPFDTSVFLSYCKEQTHFLQRKEELMSFPWWKWHRANWWCKLPNAVWYPGTKRMRKQISSVEKQMLILLSS